MNPKIVRRSRIVLILLLTGGCIWGAGRYLNSTPAAADMAVIQLSRSVQTDPSGQTSEMSDAEYKETLNKLKALDESGTTKDMVTVIE